jgi:hypothetical protein
LTGALRKDVHQNESEFYKWGLLKVQEQDSRQECPTLGMYNSQAGEKCIQYLTCGFYPNSGNVPSNLFHTHQNRDHYGPIFTVHLGPCQVMVLCGYDAVKEAPLDQAEEFGR